MYKKSRPILKTWSEKRKTDIFESLTRCYRPSPCCKVSIQLQSPLFDSGDRLWCGARLAVLREVSILISSTWSRIFGVNTVKTLCSPRVSWRQLVPQHISQRKGLSTSVAMRENLVWVWIHKKVCRWHFFFNTSGQTSLNQFLINPTMLEKQLGITFFRRTLKIFVAFEMVQRFVTLTETHFKQVIGLCD